MDIIIITSICVSVISISIYAYYTAKQGRKLGRNKSINTEGNCNLNNNVNSAAIQNAVDVDKLILKNFLGEDLVLKRLEELTNKEYREIRLDGTGMIVQHTGQALVTASQPTYTISQLNKLAPNGLFTGSVPVNEISVYQNGLYSSSCYTSNGVAAHNGFVKIDPAPLARVNPLAIIAMTMNVAAIISGQYCIVQIKKELEGVRLELEKLNASNMYKTFGALLSYESRLVEILNKRHCDSVDLYEIRNCAKEANVILRSYWSNYNDAQKHMDDYMFYGVRSDRAIDEFNRRVKTVRYLQQICLMSERIVLEAKYVEFVTRSKIDITDPSVDDLCREMEQLFLNGFTAQIKASLENDCSHIYKKASKILEQGYSGLWTYQYFGETETLIKPILESIEGLRMDFEGIALNNYIDQNSQNSKEVLLMIDQKGETRYFEAA